MTVMKKLTRKVGPAPLWVWLAVGIAGTYLLYRHMRLTGVASATGVPVTASSAGNTSGALGGGGSSGSAVGSFPANLLPVGNSVLSAVDQPATTQQFDTSATTAPTIDSGTNNAPVVTQAAAYDPAQAAAAAALGVSATPNMTLDQLNAQLAAQGRQPMSYPAVIHPDYVTSIGGPTEVAPPIFGPTPTLVQPAPVAAPVVYQPGTIVPRGTVQVA